MNDSGATRKVMRRIRRLTGPKDRAQLIEMMRDSAVQGLIEAEALSMLEGVLEVADLQVRDIMVPHNQMICVRSNDPAQRILAAAIDSGHSRFPVLDAEAETVVGILLAKDLLKLFAVNRADGFHLRDWMRKPVFVPESKRVNVLLKELRVGRNHMAIAVDEYGSVAGLVTIEDVIEQIVGDIEDEYDFDETEDNILVDRSGRYRVKAVTEIADFNKHFGTGFSDEDYDTVGGLVVGRFGRLPKRGESIVIDGFTFQVLRADSRKVHALLVEKPKAAAVGPE